MGSSPREHLVEASYIIYTEDEYDLVLARNGKTGAIDYSNPPTQIFNDGGSSFWTLVEGTGSDDSTEYKKGSNSYKVELSSQTLDAYHDYSSAQDYSSKNSFRIWMYGANTGSTIRLEFWNEAYASKTNGYYYAITDDFSGWQQFDVLRSSFTDIGTPTGWDSIMCVRLLGSTAVTATYRFDWLVNRDSDDVVIQQVIGTLPAEGGKIFVKAGVYSFCNSVNLVDKRYWVLEGEGIGGYQPNRKGQTVFVKKFNGTMLNIDYTTNDAINSFAIKNIVFYGNCENGFTGKGIVINPSKTGRTGYFSIENIRIFRTESTALEINNGNVHRLWNVLIGEVGGWGGTVGGTGHGIHYFDCYDWIWNIVEVNTNWQSSGYSAVKIEDSHGDIIGGHFEGWRCFDISGNSQVRITGAFMPWARERNIYCTATLFSLQDSFIHGANSQSEYSGKESSIVYVGNSAARIEGNLIGLYGETDPDYGLYLDTDATVNVMVGNYILRPVFIDSWQNIIVGNRLYSNTTIGNVQLNRLLGNSFVGDFQINAGAANNVLIGNYFGGSVSIPSGTVYEVKGNIGFVTENSGTATIANGQTSVTFAHGLAGTPTVVTLGATHSEVADAIWSADATNITITVPAAVTADRDISWYAEYKP